MNMQNKLYATLFFSLPDDKPASSQAAMTDLMDFAEFPKKRPNSWKSLNSQKKRIPAPWPTPIHKLSMMSMLWNISTGQLGLSFCAPFPAPAHLLIS